LILLLIVLYKLGDAFAISLTTTFLIRGVGFNAGDVGLVNKTLGLIATIIGAIYGGLLMQRLSLFRALMFFGLLQALSNAGYWLLAITAKNLFTMATAVFLENLCGGMGTAAFVALLMTLCNKSFSATQFALLSALSAIGRVYVGPIAGWFVESYGWAWFYLFSIFAALPGLAILSICRETLEYTQKTDTFQVRSTFQNYYQKAVLMLGLGVVLLALWLILLISDALSGFSLPLLAECLLIVGATLSLLGVILGSLLDYLSLRRSSTP
ncbi:MFS transporter, partial [Pectobacterium cacticida]